MNGVYKPTRYALDVPEFEKMLNTIMRDSYINNPQYEGSSYKMPSRVAINIQDLKDLQDYVHSMTYTVIEKSQNVTPISVVGWIATDFGRLEIVVHQYARGVFILT